MNRRWTDEFAREERFGEAPRPVVRRIVVEERPSSCTGCSFYAAFVEDDKGRRVAPDLGLDEAIAVVVLALGNGRPAPFLRTTEGERDWRAHYMPKPPREIEPWERFLPERATQDGEMSF